MNEQFVKYFGRNAKFQKVLFEVSIKKDFIEYRVLSGVASEDEMRNIISNHIINFLKVRMNKLLKSPLVSNKVLFDKKVYETESSCQKMVNIIYSKDWKKAE